MKNKSAKTQANSAFLFIIFTVISFGLKAQEGAYWIELPFKNPAAIATPSDWIYGVYFKHAKLSKTRENMPLQSYIGLFDYKISQKAGTIGLDFSNEKYNMLSSFLIKANYAYDIQVMETSMLSFGVSAGSTFYKTDYSIFNNSPNSDDIPSDYNYNSFNGNAGIFLHAARLSTGLSVTYEKQINGKENISLSYPSVFTGILAYRIINNDYLVITPNFMADYSSRAFYSVPGLQMEYKKLFWAGYQNFDFEDFHAISIGLDIKQKLRLGGCYNFKDFLNNYEPNIFEFVLGYRLQ